MNPDTASNIPEGDSTGTTAPGEESVTAPALPNRRTALIRSGVILLVLFVVFGIILPRFVDYGEVIDALRGLTLPEVLLMTALGAVAWFVCGQLFTVLIAGITPRRGTVAYLILSGIGSSIPFGPWNMGVVWVVLRGWGIGLQPATAGIALYGIINTLGRFALPLLAIVVIAATGDLGSSRNAAVIISVVSAVIFVIAAVVLVVVVSSESAADRLGRVLGRLVAWILA